MLVVVQGFACLHCGSPFIGYDKHCTVTGITLSGNLATDENNYVEDSDFCNACFEYSKTIDVTLIYTPDNQLLEIMEHPDEDVFLIYRVPCKVYHDTVHFGIDKPELLAKVDCNTFTRSIMIGILDSSLSEQHKLELLDIILGWREAEHAEGGETDKTAVGTDMMKG